MTQITVARIVHYALTQQNAEAINKRRQDARDSKIAQTSSGAQVHFGNEARAGDILPLLVTKVWPDGLVNGQVFLDGNDILWVSSVHERLTDPITGNLIEAPEGLWFFPPRV